MNNFIWSFILLATSFLMGIYAREQLFRQHQKVMESVVDKLDLFFKQYNKAINTYARLNELYRDDAIEATNIHKEVFERAEKFKMIDVFITKDLESRFDSYHKNSKKRWNEIQQCGKWLERYVKQVEGINNLLDVKKLDL